MPTLMELHDARRDAEYWRRVAAYLASCHAATAEHDGALKSCSMGSRERFRSICGVAADMLEGVPSWHALSRIDVDREIARCRAASKGD